MVIGYGLLVIGYRSRINTFFSSSHPFIALSPHRLIVIQFDEAEQHHGEGPEGGAAVADKGQRNSDDG